VEQGAAEAVADLCPPSADRGRVYKPSAGVGRSVIVEVQSKCGWLPNALHQLAAHRVIQNLRNPFIVA